MQVALRHLLSRAGRMVGAACVVVAAAVACETSYAAEETASSAKAKPSAKPLDSAIRLAKASRDALKKATDYTATFQKKERVGNRLIGHTMAIKHRRDPFSVYLRFIGEHDGREVIYVEGQNSGNLVVHETGLASLVGPVLIQPTSPQALSESTHPITDIGLWTLIDKVIEEWEAENGHSQVKVQYYPNARLGDKTECKVVEITRPQPNAHCKYHRSRLYIDKQTNFPARVEHFGFPTADGAEAPVMCEYQYSNIRANQSLTDLDFSTKNPKYGF